MAPSYRGVFLIEVPSSDFMLCGVDMELCSTITTYASGIKQNTEGSVHLCHRTNARKMFLRHSFSHFCILYVCGGGAEGAVVYPWIFNLSSQYIFIKDNEGEAPPYGTSWVNTVSLCSPKSLFPFHYLTIRCFE